MINLNDAIPGWASGKSTSASPNTVVDQWSGFSTGTDTIDGVHPNDSGNVKMSDRWYPAPTPLLASGGSGGLVVGHNTPVSSLTVVEFPALQRPQRSGPAGHLLGPSSEPVK